MSYILLAEGIKVKKVKSLKKIKKIKKNALLKKIMVVVLTMRSRKRHKIYESKCAMRSLKTKQMYKQNNVN